MSSEVKTSVAANNDASSVVSPQPIDSKVDKKK
jgi:hypothetical protein